MCPRDGRGRPRQETPRHHVDRIDPPTVARRRAQAIDRRRRIARMADKLMPMAVYYRQHRGSFYCAVVEGWAA
jgi:hypothetical protein